MQFTRVHLVVVAVLAVLAYVVSQKLLPRKEGLSTKPIPTGVVVTGGPREQAQRQAGGKTARRGRYPWIVKVVIKTPKGTRSGCTGFLISPTEVITANHCVDNGVQPKDISLYVGAYKDDGSDGKFKSVKSIRLGGGPSGTGKDWALLTMNYPDYEHTPVRIDGWNARVTLKKNMQVWSAGFGVGFKDQNFPVLQVTDLRLTAANSEILETSGLVDGEYRTPCGGDSGGPLFIRGGDTSQDVVIGIVSSGTGRMKDGQCRTSDHKYGAKEKYVRLNGVMAGLKAKIASKRKALVDTIIGTCSVSGRTLQNGKWKCPPSRKWDAGVSDSAYTTPAGLGGKQCTVTAQCAVAINKAHASAGAQVNPVRYIA